MVSSFQGRSSMVEREDRAMLLRQNAEQERKIGKEYTLQSDARRDLSFVTGLPTQIDFWSTLLDQRRRKRRN